MILLYDKMVRLLLVRMVEWLMFVFWCGDNSQSYMMGPERLVNTIVINISGSAGAEGSGHCKNIL